MPRYVFQAPAHHVFELTRDGEDVQPIHGGDEVELSEIEAAADVRMRNLDAPVIEDGPRPGEIAVNFGTGGEGNTITSAAEAGLTPEEVDEDPPVDDPKPWGKAAR